MKELRRWGDVAVIGIEKPVYLRGRRIELLFIAGDNVKKLCERNIFE